jgi:hypothetical protein
MKPALAKKKKKKSTCSKYNENSGEPQAIFLI